MIHTFLHNFQQCGKSSDQIASHQAENSTEEKFIHQRSLSMSDLQLDYLNLVESVRNNEIANFYQSR